MCADACTRTHTHTHAHTHTRTNAVLLTTRMQIIETFCMFQTERDVSVRQRAIDLLYAMCDRSNATTIVGELLNYLEKADYSIREELVRMILTNNVHNAFISWYVQYM